MRLLFEHARTYSVAHTKFVMTGTSQASLTYVASKRDLFFRAFQDPAQSGHTNAHIYAFRSLDEAVNFPGTTSFPYTSTALTTWGVVAYKEDQALTGSSQTVTLTNNAGVSPDVTGLTVTINGSGDAVTAWNAVYGYTASPAVVVLEEIAYLVGQRMNEGQILGGFTNAHIRQWPENLSIASEAPDVVASIAGETGAVQLNGRFALGVDFVLLIGSRGLEDRTYRDVMRYAGSVRSLLADEEWDLNLGVSDPVAHAEVVIGEVTGPMAVEGEQEPYLAARIAGRVTFPVLYSDRS